MPASVVIGLQWGDEGKGKVVDLLAEQAHLVVRSQGGNNAGHTIVHHGKEYRFHLIPSGILYPHTTCVVAGGTVINPQAIWEEIEQLEAGGITLQGRLWISPYAHVIFPFHCELDRLLEQRRGGQAIGTTGRGIGPCYVDKAARVGIRIGELIDPDTFRGRLEALVSLKNQELTLLYGKPAIDVEALYKEFIEWGKRLKPFVAPVEKMVSRALKAGKHVLFEGAHGALLDQTFGSYPYVTSSGTLPSSVLAGAGLSMENNLTLIGVFKAYTTRVGSGPFPTELDSQEIQGFPSHESMREVGTTTGRKRRIGWLDLFILRHILQLSNVSRLAMTKIDILDKLPRLKLCTGYRLNGKMIDEPPIVLSDWERVEPVYIEMEGWQTSTAHCKDIKELPEKARRYIEKIESFCELPICALSLGPDRSQTLHLQPLTPAPILLPL